MKKNKMGTARNPTDIETYRSKYTMDLDTGTVHPKVVGSAQNAAPRLEVKMLENGMAEVYVPALANGCALNFWQGDNCPTTDQTFFSSERYPTHRQDGKAAMEKAIYWWRHDPIFFKCIRLLCQLANTRLKISSKSEEAKTLVEFWFEQAMPVSFRKAWFLEYFRSGMVPVIKTLIPYVPREYKPDKIPQTDDGDNVDDTTVNDVVRVKAVASKTKSVVDEHRRSLDEYKLAVAAAEQARVMHRQGLCSADRLAKYEQAIALKQYEWLKGNIAGAYTLLNPLCVDIEGPAELQWMREPYLRIGHELQSAINNPTPLQAAMLTRLPTEIVTQIKNGQTKVWLSPNICTITYGDKQDYDQYPTPIAQHAFRALEMKAELYEMDRATIHSVKNRILLIKIGSDQYPVTDPNQLHKVSAIFNAMGRTGHFVWSHAIEMEWIEPDNNGLAEPKKYQHWNDEIRAITGVNPIFTGTTEASSSIGNSIMNFKAMETEVNEAQASFLEFLNKEIKLLRTALGVSADVDVVFDQLNLKDEVAFISVIMQMVMNGLLDPETALETMGFHFPEVRNRMEKMLKDRKKGLFTPTPSANNMGPDGKPLPQGGAAGNKPPGGSQSKPGGAGGVQTGGRPKNQTSTNKNAQKRGKSQPKKSVTLTLKAVGSEVFGIVDAELDPEQMEDTCTFLSVPEDHVLTKAQFEERFPDEDIIAAWPELGNFEVMQASAGAIKMVVSYEEQTKRELEKWKADNKPASGRGPYITEDVRQGCWATAKTNVDFDYLKSVTGLGSIPDELHEAWEKHMEASQASIRGQVEGMSDEHVYAQAWAMCCARLKRSMS